MARDVGARGHFFDAGSYDMMRSKGIGHFKSDPKESANFDNGNTCNYCHEKGHWKADCAVLKAKTRRVKANVRLVAFAAPVKDCVSELLTPHTCESQVLESYAPFIRGGSVSLVGSNVEVPIKILRDTGAYNSYIVDTILAFSVDTFTDGLVLSQRMGLSIFPSTITQDGFELSTGSGCGSCRCVTSVAYSRHTPYFGEWLGWKQSLD